MGVEQKMSLYDLRKKIQELRFKIIPADSRIGPQMLETNRRLRIISDELDKEISEIESRVSQLEKEIKGTGYSDTIKVGELNALRGVLGNEK